MTDAIDLPDTTTDRLRTARQNLERAQQRWNELTQTACEVAGVDPQEARIDLQSGIIRPKDAPDA